LAVLELPPTQEYVYTPDPPEALIVALPLLQLGGVALVMLTLAVKLQLIVPQEIANEPDIAQPEILSNIA
jgi:hypothetical protein